MEKGDQSKGNLPSFLCWGNDKNEEPYQAPDSHSNLKCRYDSLVGTGSPTQVSSARGSSLMTRAGHFRGKLTWDACHLRHNHKPPKMYKILPDPPLF